MRTAQRSVRRLRFRAGVGFAAGWLGAAASIAPAQTLELTHAPAPPPFPAPSAVAAIVKVLEQEANDLATAASNADSDAMPIALRARTTIRRLAAELLALGDRRSTPGPDDATIAGNIVVLKGLKLAAGRDALDAAIARAAAVDDGVTALSEDARRDALSAFSSFNQAYADHVTDGAPSGASVDQWTASLLSRLLPVIVGEGDKPPSSPWVEDRQASAGGTTTQPVEDTVDLLRRLRDRVSTAAVDEQSRANLRSTLDFLDRGAQFAELRPRVAQYVQTLSDLLDFDEAVAAATWLSEADREQMQSSLAQAIVWCGDPATRAQGQDAANRLNASRAAIEASTNLVADNVDVKPLRRAMAVAQSSASKATTSDAAARPMTQLAVILERMVAYRELGPSGLAKDLRNAERELAKTYRDSEQKVLKELAREDSGALAERAVSDPALSSLLADHRQRLEDLQRLRRMPQWGVAIAQINPPASKDFDAQLKRWAQALLEPTRRPNAILTMSRFEQELDQFAPPRLPFEDALKQARPEAIELCAGQHEQVLAVVVEQRRAWADDWSRQEQTPEPSKAMALTRQLLQTMRDASALTRLDPEMLNRWPMWQMSADMVDRERREVITRLKLASAALIQRDPAMLSEQLSRVEREAPLARLAGRLAHVLGNDLAERESDAMGLLAQFVFEPPAPPRRAMLIEQRGALADLCRCVAEAEHARGNGQGEAADEINAYVHDLIGRLLVALE